MKHLFGFTTLLAIMALGNGPGTSLADAPEVKELGSYIFTMVTGGPGSNIQLQGAPYIPAEGDLFLFDDHNKLVTNLYRLVGTKSPLHTALAFRRPDGTMALLEAGPNLDPKVYIVNVVPRLHAYNGTVLVRRLKTPLAPEQCDKLTQFAMAQEGKPYARIRLILQGTPFRPRGPIRKALFGHTSLDRSCWTCCELTGAAATAAGVLIPKVHFANAMYPRDFAYDEDFDISSSYREAALWYPRAELKMVGNGVEVGYPGDRHKPLPQQ